MQLVLENINKHFDQKKVLTDFSLTIENNSSVAILGDSGKGKSTLLNLMALFEKVDSGNIFIDKINVNSKDFNKMMYWRYNLGYLFQNYALVDNLSVEKNLDIALKYVDKNRKEKKLLKEEVLSNIGLAGSEKKMVYTLSGGEQQRLGIARLMLKPCELVLADEPIGALDNSNKQYVIELLNSLRNLNKTLVIVTHDKDVAKICDNIIEL